MVENAKRKFKRVCITGGAGFIGSHLVRYLNENTDWEITVLDSLTYAGNLDNLMDCEYEFIKMDISNKDAVSELAKYKEYDCVIHLAAESHVDNSINSPDIFVTTNVNGTVNLLNAARKWHEKNPNFVFYYVSTDEVFGSLPLGTDEKFNEETPYKPHSPYSASKASSDHFVRAYYDTYKLPILISNCSNNYGSHQYPEKLIPVVVNKLINRENIPVYGTGDNERDWLYVVDHCRAIKTILENGTIGETYCIGSKDVVSNLDLVQMICDIYDDIHISEATMFSRDLITFVEDRKGHDKKYAIDYTKLSTKLNWKPEMELKEGMKKTILWYIVQKKY